MKNLLHYTDTGHGETTLVFLHYFGGSSKTWAAVIELLKNSFRCIAVDLPGFGASSPLVQQPTVENTAVKVNELLQALSLKNVVLIGHSMGGKVALALAAKRPVGVKQLILVAPSPPTPEPMSNAERKSLLDAFGNKMALEKIAKGLTAEPLSVRQLKEVFDDNLRVHRSAWDGWIEEGSKEDISGQMKNIDVPVTVVTGDSDKNFSTSFLKPVLGRWLPVIKFIEMEGTGHLLPIEKPAALADCIQVVLKQVKP